MCGWSDASWSIARRSRALLPPRARPQLPVIVPAAIERCPVCRAKVLVRLPGEIVIHNAILRVDAASERVTAKCPRCKSWVEVPLRFIG